MTLALLVLLVFVAGACVGLFAAPTEDLSGCTFEVHEVKGGFRVFSRNAKNELVPESVVASSRERAEAWAEQYRSGAAPIRVLGKA